MKSVVLKSSTLAVAGRLDAKYGLALAQYLSVNNLEETPENTRIAMEAIRLRDTEKVTEARDLRAQAGAIVDRARELEQEADLTFPNGYRP